MSIRQKPELLVTVFSDYICPFCYIGFLRLEKLRVEYDLKVNWCLLEIHPDNPAEGRPVAELGYSDEQWQEMLGEFGQMAHEEGIRLSGQSCTTNSRKALLLGEAALEFDISGTPTIFIGKRKLVGALPTDTLFRAAREALATESNDKSGIATT